MRKEIQIGVVGAGIAGLTLGRALQKQGFQVEVFEGHGKNVKMGSGITLAPNALGLLESLDVWKILKEKGCPQADGQILWQDGSLIAEVGLKNLEAKFSFPVIAFYRHELIEALASTLKEPSLHYGDAVLDLQEIDDKVLMLNESGRRTFDLVLVADGLHSKLRDRILGPRTIRYSGQTSWRGISEHSVETGAEIWGRDPGLRFGFVPLHDGRTYFYATALSAPKQKDASATAALSSLKSLFRSFPSGVVELLEGADPSRLLRTDIEDLVPQSGWSSGRIAFVGDAVHATTPNLGQGACQAIESAVSLARCLDEEANIKDAFRLFEERRLPRTRFITESSWRINQLVNQRGLLGRWLRKYLLRLVPASVNEKNLVRVYTPTS